MTAMQEKHSQALVEEFADGHAVVGVPEQPSRMLVCDDEHLVAAGLAADLTALGYEVVGLAHDGDSAMEMCRNDRPDLVFMDIRMSGRDGLSTAAWLYRELGMPVIVVSAYSQAEYAEGGARAGVFGYLLKPVTLDQLRVSILVAWSRYIEHAAQSGEIGALKQRLEDRKIIERAKWLIVQRRSVGEPEAMKMLQRQARNRRLLLADVAREVVEDEVVIDSSTWLSES